MMSPIKKSTYQHKDIMFNWSFFDKKTLQPMIKIRNVGTLRSQKLLVRKVCTFQENLWNTYRVVFDSPPPPFA